MKHIDILDLYAEVRLELRDQGIIFPKEPLMSSEIETMHKSGEINLWNMTEEEIKLTIRKKLAETN